MEKLLSLLDKLLDSALDELYEKDHYLLEHDVHERTIVFRLGHYLQNLMDATGEFQNFNLDLSIIAMVDTQSEFQQILGTVLSRI